MTELFDRFQYYLLKYRALLKAGVIDMNYADIRAFLSLYCDRSTRWLLLSGKMNQQVERVISRKMTELRNQYADIGEEDLDSIIDLTFFQCVKIYDSKGKVRKECKALRDQDGNPAPVDYDTLTPEKQLEYDLKFPPVGFSGFLFNYYYYMLRKNLDNETRGVIPGIGWCKPLEGGGIDGNSMEIDLELSEEMPNLEWQDIDEIIAADIIIDHAWIDGKTASWPFSDLSKLDRWILKLRFADRLFSNEIADTIGMSPSVIRNRIKRIRDQITTLLQEQ